MSAGLAVAPATPAGRAAGRRTDRAVRRAPRIERVTPLSRAAEEGRRAVPEARAHSQAFWKLAAILGCMGACACGLLSLRQSRLQAAHELAEARLRVQEHDERLLLLRSRIAARISPDELEDVLLELDRDVPGFRSRLDERWLLGERPDLMPGENDR